MRDIQVISKGRYPFPQSDPLLTIQNFIIVSEDGEKYLLLKWKNRRGEVLGGLRLTASFYDASDNLIERRKLSFEALSCGANASFVLEPKIQIPEDCVDFKIVLDSSRYGNYRYSAGKDGVVADYDAGSGPAVGRSVGASNGVGKKRTVSTGESNESGKSAAKPFDVSERRPKLPKWLAVLSCVLLISLAAFTCLRVNEFKDHSNSFLKDGVEYTFSYNGTTERTELYVIGYYGNRKEFTIRDSIEDVPVTTILDSAFADNSSVEKVTLKGSLTIGGQAFSNCSKLSSINLENVTSIGSNAFSDCKMLSDVTANQLTEIGDRAFSQCRRLASVVIQNSEMPLKIGRGIFRGCNSLDSVKIDQFIDYRNSYALDIFSDAEMIKTLELKNFPSSSDGFQAPTVRSLFDSYSYPTVNYLKIGEMQEIPKDFCVGLPVERVEIGQLAEPKIGDGAFQGCNILRNVRLPEIEQIGAIAFADCYSLEKFEMGSSLISIGEMAFRGCQSLNSVKIPSSVEFIGNGAFENCDGLTEISVPFLGNSRDSDSGAIRDIFGNYVPSSLKSVTVTGSVDRINEFAFSGCGQLERIVLPDSVTSIGENAFQECRMLSEFECPKNLVSIGDNAFFHCTSLTEFTLPPTLKYIGTDAFECCYRLYEIRNESLLNLSGAPGGVGQITKFALKIYAPGESSVPVETQDGFRFAWFEGGWTMVGYPKNRSNLVLPNFVQSGTSTRYSVADYLFLEENQLQKVTVSSSVKEIGRYAFQNCYSLQKVAFQSNSNLTVLREGTFQFCSSLLNVTLPEGITRIESAAFRDCVQLESVVLPKSLSAIGEQAFLGCEGLKKVYNLSGLTIVKGGKSYGYVAYYAENVFRSLDEKPKTV